MGATERGAPGREARVVVVIVVPVVAYQAGARIERPMNGTIDCCSVPVIATAAHVHPLASHECSGSSSTHAT